MKKPLRRFSAKDLADVLKKSKAHDERAAFIRDLLPMFAIFVAFLIFLVMIAYVTR